jgi:hypothetical protein
LNPSVFSVVNEELVIVVVIFVIVVNRKVSKDMPLTIGGATACFVSPDTLKSGWSPLLPSGNANYANPREWEDARRPSAPRR